MILTITLFFILYVTLNQLLPNLPIVEDRAIPLALSAFAGDSL